MVTGCFWCPVPKRWSWCYWWGHFTDTAGGTGQAQGTQCFTSFQSNTAASAPVPEQAGKVLLSPFYHFYVKKGFPAHPLSWSSCPTCLVWSMWIIQPGPLFLCTDRRLRQLPCCLPTACSIWTVLNAPLYPKLLSFKPSSIINVLLRNICFVFQPRTPVEASLMPTKIQLLACQLLRLFLFEVWVTRKGELKPV